MEDLVKMFISRVKGERLSGEEYRKVLLEFFNKAGDLREKSKIIFDARRRRKRILLEKKEVEDIVKDMMSVFDDWSEKNISFFKKVANKYNYHYKHIK